MHGHLTITLAHPINIVAPNGGQMSLPAGAQISGTIVRKQALPQGGNPMEKKDFLPQLGPDDQNRKVWWEKFQKAVALAKECVGGWGFGELNTIALTNDTCWCQDGTLKIKKDDLAKGSLYHELFHPVLHNSPFKRKAETNKIDYRLHCESLCNAFQYFMEAKIGPADGEWATRVAKWRPKSWAQIISESGDISYDMTYGMPALEYIKACANFDEFKKMFAVMNAKS